MSDASPYDLGRATVSPRRALVAGQYTTVVFTYTAGHPVDDTGYIKLAFRQLGDFGKPQFNDPAAPNYCTLRTTGDCRLIPRWDQKGNRRPWSQALYVQVRYGFLAKGEKIVITFGDTSGGSPGWRAQTFREATFELKTYVDPIASYEFKELPESPTLRIRPGEPDNAVCVAPSVVKAGERFEYFIKAEDRWGNPVAKPKRCTHPGFKAAGVRTVTAQWPGTKLKAESNPIDVVVEAPAMRPYWADLHAQSEETIGSNSIDDYFAFARDMALLDAAAHQGNDFQVTDAFWRKVNETTRAYNEPGRFVTFPGYEWSGNTPLGGDRNVYFAEEGGTITRSCCELIDGSRYPDSPTADDLFANLKGPSPFVFAHVGGRYADLRMHDEATEVAVEIHSSWGTFEWLAEDALRMGYRVGFVANSDDHKGRPGRAWPGATTFGNLGGLTCILAERLDRGSVREAICARRTIATTGHRPLLDVSLALPDGSGASIGGIAAAKGDSAALRVRYAGTAPLLRVEVRNGLETIHTWRPYRAADLGRRVLLIWSGAEVRGRGRMVAWDGRLRVTGNGIIGFQPINFCNLENPMRQDGANGLSWRSVTTGGTAGVLMTLSRRDSGRLLVETEQGGMKMALRRIGLAPRTWELGGLDKQMSVCRLPEAEAVTRAADITLPIRALRKGDNPIFVKVVQEDGHTAWTSPIYVTR